MSGGEGGGLSGGINIKEYVANAVSKPVLIGFV